MLVLKILDDVKKKGAFAQKETGLKGPNLYHPIRYVLTGSSAGSELSHICELLGKKNVLYRLSKYI